VLNLHHAEVKPEGVEINMDVKKHFQVEEDHIVGNLAIDQLKYLEIFKFL
jgi:hypothetical protein